MKGFCPLASGSKGNSLIFSSGQTKILVDAGITARQTKLRLAELDVDLDDIDAILISHEHRDHVAGLQQLALRRHIPVLCNAETAKAIYANLGECPQFKVFSTGEAFEFGDIEIHPFSIQHDAVEPCAFTLKVNSLKVGICTDLGFATTLVQSQLQGCDYLYLEANHEPEMVMACPRSPYYKERVLSRSGHLSNEDAGKLVSDIWHSGLKHIHLAHLSEECNHPEKALERVRLQVQGETTVSIAPQKTIGQVIHVE